MASYRDASPANPDRRYLASDFSRLTHRRVSSASAIRTLSSLSSYTAPAAEGTAADPSLDQQSCPSRDPSVTPDSRQQQNRAPDTSHAGGPTCEAIIARDHRQPPNASADKRIPDTSSSDPARSVIPSRTSIHSRGSTRPDVTAAIESIDLAAIEPSAKESWSGNHHLSTADHHAIIAPGHINKATSPSRLFSSNSSANGAQGPSRPDSISRSSSTTGGVPADVCVKEDNSGIAQSFLESASAAADKPRDPLSPLEAPGFADNDNCECCCRCGKKAQARYAGKQRLGRKAKSYTSLRTGISELSGWDDEVKPRPDNRPVEKKQYGKAESLIERLPAEILDDIVADLAIDLPPSGYAPRNVDLIACLLTSKTLHVATINTLYRHVTVPHSQIFSKFLRHILEYPGFGSLVRRLDLSHFTSVGLGRSRQANSEIQNLTAKSLLRCLELTPWIQEVLLQENLDDDLDDQVLTKLFLGLPKVRALDFCASSSPPFVDAFQSLCSTLKANPSIMIGVKRLSLHECFTLPKTVYEILLPRLTRLTHLDVSHTRITNDALASLPASARLTHLNLGRCTQITGEGVVDFLTEHPAARGLVYLNLSCDVSRYRLLWEADVDRLLPKLPTTLRSLNLNGAHIHPHHIRMLSALTKHVEELGLASADLTLADINALFRPPISTEVPSSQDTNMLDDTPSSTETPHWTPSTIHYLDLTSIPAITQSTLFNTPLPSNILLTPATLPLEVIELGDKVISSLRECRNTNKRLGWCVKELGRRGWYVRDPGHSNSAGAPTIDDAAGRGGRRGWKMGAMWWGMRKVPVAWGEVGGLYGHYMFKK